MAITLSSRLTACCNFVHPGDRVADIGCDHGYLGIHLLQTGVARSVIAADVREGPLECAKRNGEKYGLSQRITFCLSDGVQDIPRDFDTLVCAGMGADTMISILSAAPWLKDDRYRLILQCQSKRPMLRQWLYAQGYAIARETLAKDGKFVYSVMEVTFCPGQTYEPWECYISRQLLKDNHLLLPEYRQRVCQGLRLSVAGMAHSPQGEKADLEAILHMLEQQEVQR